MGIELKYMVFYENALKFCFTIPIGSYAIYGSGLFYTKLLFVYFLLIAPLDFSKIVYRSVAFSRSKDLMKSYSVSTV